MSFKTFNPGDIVEGFVSRDLTANLWSGAVSDLTVAYTSSTQTGSDSGNYHWFIYNGDPSADSTATVQYSIAWGNRTGGGTAKINSDASDGITPSKAVYNQFANLMLNPTDGIFTVDETDQDSMAFISVNRSRYKQQMNPGGWQLTLSASVDGLPLISLIDDSTTTSPTSVNGSTVYNVVSGSIADGVLSPKTTYGVFYPEIGVIALASTKLSESGVASDFAITPDTDEQNIEKIWTAVTGGASFIGRSQEDVSSTNYFVRLFNSEMNYSNNPSFITGSGGYLRYSYMADDPEVYLTTVGLYNDANELLAVAKLSKPLPKNFEREATIRVKLDY